MSSATRDRSTEPADGAAAGRRPNGPDILVVSGSSQTRTPAALNHAVYAARHGLRYVFDTTPAPVRLIYLHKVEVLRRHLATADWLFWIDDDAFFTNLAVDVRSFLPVDPAIELVFCSSPVNPDGGWTWMSAGQFLIRNTPAMLALLDAVLATDLGQVRSWWDPDTLGLFTRGDQDAFVYQLRRDGSPWSGAWQARPWEAFNSRPYHYVASLDEHFICHFAVPGGRSKMELIAEFATRLGTTTALLPAAEIEPYRTFSARSDFAPFLDVIASRGPAVRDPTRGPAALTRRPPSLPRRIARTIRRRLRR